MIVLTSFLLQSSIFAETNNPKEPEFQIVIDSALPEYVSAVYLAYAMSREVSRKEFDKQNPGKSYAETVQEQLKAYEDAASIWAELKESNKGLSDPTLDFISDVHAGGYLEAFVFEEYKGRFPQQYKQWFSSNMDRLSKYQSWKNRLRNIPFDLKLDNHVSFLKGFVSHGTYVNDRFPLEFPEKIGGFERGKITIYDPSEENFSVGYNFRSAHLNAWATVYIYPAEDPNGLLYSFDQHFEELKSDVNAHNANTILMHEASARMSSADGIVEGKMAVFSVYQDFNLNSEKLWSQLYLFSYGRWFIKLRITYPDAKHDGVDGEVKLFIDSFHLPSKNKTVPVLPGTGLI